MRRVTVLENRSQIFAEKSATAEAERDQLGLLLEEITEKYNSTRRELDDTLKTLADL